MLLGIADGVRMSPFITREIEGVSIYFNIGDDSGPDAWSVAELAAGPLLEQWVAPLKDLGVRILSLPTSSFSSKWARFRAASIRKYGA